MNSFISFYMVYSKRVTDLQQIYQLTPDDVFFCMLVASGASRGEAYATIFRPRSTKIETAQRGAAQLAKDKPGINKLIRSFEDNRAAFLPDNDSPKSKKKKKNTEAEEEEKAGNVVQYRDKDAVLSGLEQTLPYLRGKDRADVLMKIADLQQMKKDENTEEEEGSSSKLAVALVTLVIIIVWLAILALLIKWDVGGFGSGVLAPILKDVPYVNKILPDDAVEQVSTEDSAYAYDTMADAVERIKELEKELADAQNASSANADYISQLEAQSQELQQYKENEAEFEKEKQSFYEDVVFSDVAPDIEEYKKYYESIDPANAEVLYKQVVAQTAEDEQLDDYIKTYSSMKPKEAAAIFDTMTDNLKLVAQILDGMDADSRAAILGKMTSDTAAKVTEIMKPSEQIIKRQYMQRKGKEEETWEATGSLGEKYGKTIG